MKGRGLHGLFHWVARDAVQALGHSESLTYAPWPAVNESLLVEDTFKLPVQVCPCILQGSNPNFGNIRVRSHLGKKHLRGFSPNLDVLLVSSSFK